MTMIFLFQSPARIVGVAVQNLQRNCLHFGSMKLWRVLRFVAGEKDRLICKVEFVN